MIQETIDTLKALQDILSRKFQIEQEIQELPKALSTKTELLNRMKKSYIEKNTKYQETKQRLRDLREQMEAAEREREKYEEQMDLIKTQREYEALDKEIRDASEREQTLRKELQKEDKILQEMSQTLEREESLIKQQEEELEQEQAKVKDETDAKKKSLKELEKEEKKLVPDLDEELLFKFERIIRSQEGEGIVPLKKGVCTGCQMILPAQFVNDVRKGEEILFCPYCSKVVFYVGDDESTFDEQDAEGLADLVGSLSEEGLPEDLLQEEPLEMGEEDTLEESDEEEITHDSADDDLEEGESYADEAEEEEPDDGGEDEDDDDDDDEDDDEDEDEDEDEEDEDLDYEADD